MSWFKKAAAAPALVAMALLAGACGFEPLYGSPSRVEPGTTTAALGQISVSTPQNRIGSELRNALAQALGIGPDMASLYSLVLDVRVTEENVAIEQDSEVTRRNLIVQVPYQLIETATGEPLIADTMQLRAAYNRLDSEFANIIAKRNAESRAAQQIAYLLRQRIAVYFERRASEARAS